MIYCFDDCVGCVCFCDCGGGCVWDVGFWWDVVDYVGECVVFFEFLCGDFVFDWIFDFGFGGVFYCLI